MVSGIVSFPLAIGMYLTDFPSLLLAVVNLYFFNRFIREMHSINICRLLCAEQILENNLVNTVLINCFWNLLNVSVTEPIMLRSKKRKFILMDLVEISSSLRILIMDCACKNLNLFEMTCVLALIYLDKLIHRNGYLFFVLKKRFEIGRYCTHGCTNVERTPLCPDSIICDQHQLFQTWNCQAEKKIFLAENKYKLFISDSKLQLKLTWRLLCHFVRRCRFSRKNEGKKHTLCLWCQSKRLYVVDISADSQNWVRSSHVFSIIYVALGQNG